MTLLQLKQIYLIGKDLPSIDPTEEVSKVIAISPAGALIASTEGKNQAEYVAKLLFRFLLICWLIRAIMIWLQTY